MSIQVENISKAFDKCTVLSNFSMNIKNGELMALLGPSGSGKTTLLRIIAGLENPDTGNVFTDGVNIVNKTPRERSVGFVFQQFALFKHMSVYENVSFGLKMLPKNIRPSTEEIDHKVRSLLKLFRIEHLCDRYPKQLSGGQKQRVAITRSLAVEPKILLLDEPFGSLDAGVRKELRSWMRQLHNDINLTTIFVTHDQEEAMEVADKVVVMNNGRIEQIGTPLEVYQNPSNAFVYKFLGNYNEFNGIKDEKGLIHLSEFEGDNENTTIDLPKYQPSWFKRNLSFLMKKVTSAKAQAILPKTNSNVVGEVVKVFARPHEMDIKKEPTNGYLAVKIVHINAAGSFVKLDMARENGSLISAEMAQDILENLSIAKNDIVYTRPRDTKIFGNTAKV